MLSTIHTTLAHHYIDSHIHYHDRTPPRFVTVYVGFPMLTLSEAEHGVYHNRRVSDALHRHRIFDTTPMSLLPLASYLSTLFYLFTFFLLKKFVI